MILLYHMHSDVYDMLKYRVTRRESVIPSFCILFFQDVMRRLVSRFIHQMKKEMRQDGVNADDLLEIKQDISSLR